MHEIGMKRSRACWGAAAAIVVLLASGPRGNAQATTATIVGTVTDTTGAALGGATVTATNQSTGQRYVHQTNGSGNYEFTLLPPGVYSVEVRMRVSRTRRRTAYRQR
jgi:Carboxypeptidase regulatory-like domain